MIYGIVSYFIISQMKIDLRRSMDVIARYYDIYETKRRCSCCLYGTVTIIAALFVQFEEHSLYGGIYGGMQGL